jgi:TRAP-type C4-dicarboxylate transport system permease small subunit
MTPIILSYSIYSGFATVLTVGLAKTLSRHGHVFLEDVFPDRPTLAKSINQLLVVGFFMLNLGYAFFLMRQTGATNGQSAFEGLAKKLGILLVSLAAIHFANVAVFWKIRRSQVVRELPPPVAASMLVPR